MTLSTSAVAVCCSRASCSSSLSSTTSLSAPLRGSELLTTLGELRLFNFDDLGRRDLAGLPLALERRFIASPVQDRAS